MNNFFGDCARYRRSICLLACRELTSERQARLRNHLAVCADCREYHDEISNVASALATWERNFEEVEPSQAALARWAGEITGALELEQPAREGRHHWLIDWCKEMIWPSRRIWAGLATAWLVILVLNLSERDPARTEAAKSSRASLEMVRAYLTHEGFLGEPGGRGQKRVTVPSAVPAPTPRSEQRGRSSTS